MKTFVTLIAAVVMAFCVTGIEYNAETAKKLEQLVVGNYQERDQNVVNEALAIVNSIEPATDLDRLNRIYWRVAIHDQEAGADRTFDGLSSYASALLNQETFENPVPPVWNLMLINLYWKSDDPAFCTAMYNQFKANPPYRDVSESGLWAAMAGQYSDAYDFYMQSKFWPDRASNVAIYHLNDPRKAFDAAQMILERRYNSTVVSSVINDVAAHLVSSSEITADEMKTFLQGVNRSYSILLIDDDAAWRPVITRVRTMLETY